MTGPPDAGANSRPVEPGDRGVVARETGVATIVETVVLATPGAAVVSPDHLVYSTGPSLALGVDGEDYFTKGRGDVDIAFSEIAGCLLAQAVGLSVPRVVVCRYGDEAFCGSRKAAEIGRNIEPFLKKRSVVENFEELYCAVVVDSWLVNVDRNMGNVIASDGMIRGRTRLYFIDFEKSIALKPNPIVSSTMVRPPQLWPTADLGRMLKAVRPLTPPASCLAAIRELGCGRIRQILQTVSAALGGVEWWEYSADVLCRRATRIDEIAGEVWAES